MINNLAVCPNQIYSFVCRVPGSLLPFKKVPHSEAKLEILLLWNKKLSFTSF
jgi:hypothetical protein